MKGSGTAGNVAKTALGGEAGIETGWKERQGQEQGQGGRKLQRSHVQISANYSRQLRELHSKTIPMDHNKKTRVFLRFLQTSPSHLHHKTRPRGASRAELHPGLGWDWFYPVPEQRQLHSHCQWGPVRA